MHLLQIKNRKKLKNNYKVYILWNMVLTPDGKYSLVFGKEEWITWLYLPAYNELLNPALCIIFYDKCDI